jgi:hypothetical protein
MAICVRKKAFTSARPASLPCPPRYPDAVKNIRSLSAVILRSASFGVLAGCGCGAVVVVWQKVVMSVAKSKAAEAGRHHKL